MGKKVDSIEFESRHDVKGVTLVTSNDMVELTLDEAVEVHKKLIEAIDSATHNTPPAPAPYKFDENDKVSFAECGKCVEGFQCYVTIANHEVYVNQLQGIRDWIDKVLEYHKHPSCLE